MPADLIKLIKEFLKKALCNDKHQGGAMPSAIENGYNMVLSNTKAGRIQALIKEVNRKGIKQVPVMVERVMQQYKADHNCTDTDIAKGNKHVLVYAAQRAINDYLLAYDKCDVRFGNEAIIRFGQLERRNSAPNLGRLS